MGGSSSLAVGRGQMAFWDRCLIKQGKRGIGHRCSRNLGNNRVVLAVSIGRGAHQTLSSSRNKTSEDSVPGGWKLSVKYFVKPRVVTNSKKNKTKKPTGGCNQHL